MISRLNSQKIRNMGLLCAILVVSIHIDWPQEGVLGYVMNVLLQNGIARIAVPFFFVVSGYFLAAHFDEQQWWKREVFKRFKTLGIPYICWIIITAVCLLPISIIADILANREFGHSIHWIHGNNWISALGFDMTRGPMLGPLWYVRCLLLFAMLGEFFKWAVCKFSYLWLLCMFCLDLTCNYFPESVKDFFTIRMRFGGLATGALYFSVGIFLKYHSHITIKDTIKYICICLGGGLFLARSWSLYMGWYFEAEILKMALPFLIYSFWVLTPSGEWPLWLTQAAFPIYLTNTIIIDILNIVSKFICANPPFLAFIVFFCATVVPVVLSAYIHRHFSKLAEILFGGR